MAKPTNYPEWATNTITEVALGTDNKIEPPQGLKDDGLLPVEPLGRQYLNYHLNLIDQWVQFFDGDGGANPRYTMTVYDSSGTLTHTPSPNTTAIKFTAIGGGGGAGGMDPTIVGQCSAGVGGGAGGVAIKTSSVINTSYTIVVGDGGGPSGSNGNAGQTSSVTDDDGGLDVTITAEGGDGGEKINSTTATVFAEGAFGGNATGGDINIEGGASGGMVVISGDPTCLPDSGQNIFSDSQPAQIGTGGGFANSTPGRGLGGGASAVVVHDGSSGGLGAGGATGAVIVEEWS